jgi:hypothetical protein
VACRSQRGRSSVYVTCSLALFCVRLRVYVQFAIIIICYVTYDRDSYMAGQPQWTRASSLLRPHDYTQTHHIRQDSSELVISRTQRPFPDNTQHSKETDIHAAGEIRTRNPSKRIHALDRAFPGIGFAQDVVLLNSLTPDGGLYTQLRSDVSLSVRLRLWLSSGKQQCVVLLEVVSVLEEHCLRIHKQEH